MMGETYWQEFLEKVVYHDGRSLSEYVLTRGIETLLSEFENWLMLEKGLK